MRGFSISTSLRLKERERAPDRESPVPHRRREELWLAIRLPELPLNALTGRHSDVDPAQPAAVYEIAAGQLRIVAANAAARRSGVVPGLTVGAALALAGSLELDERSPSAEDACIEAIADWAYRLTPSVSLEPREALLLEVFPSLTLFGGLDVIRSLIGDELRRRGVGFLIGVAPTPLAALWSARQGDAGLSDRHRLVSHLSRLSLAVTAWPDTVLKCLREMGVRTVGDCLRLPRGGLARRIGAARLDDLDRAIGRQPDLRRYREPPEPLSRALELPRETRDRGDIVKVLTTAIESIAEELLRRQQQIRQLKVGFTCIGGTLKPVQIDFVDPLHTAADLLAPLVVRLESVRLPAPVAAMTVETGPLLPLRIDVPSLLDDPETRPVSSQSRTVLIECLRGHFGREQVYGFTLQAEHRPERAFRQRLEDIARPCDSTAEPEAVACRRPLWLLSEPQRLADDTLRAFMRTDTPCPERIESGWWDGSDVRRDYYIVTTGSGERWWVYRDRDTRGWHLHGLFG